jgi:hypothetical protein
MKRTVKISGLVMFAVVIALITISCNQNDDPLVYNPELVFTNSFKVDVNPYQYANQDSTEFFWICGDSAIVTDTVSSTPVFKWTNVLADLITVVISKEKFMVADDAIENADQIVWQWHPGLDSGEYGNVAYMDGRMVKNENILENTQPLPLESGLYYWVVYGWNGSARDIVFSSKPLEIYVKD